MTSSFGESVLSSLIALEDNFYSWMNDKDAADAAGGGGVTRQGNVYVINDENNNNNSGEDIVICPLVALQPFTTPDGTPWNFIGTYETVATIALAAQHWNTRNGSVVPVIAASSDNDEEDAWCPQVKFTLLPSVDTALDERTAVNAVIRLTDENNDNNSNSNNTTKIMPCAILGALRSAVSKPTSIVTGLRGYPQISFGSSADALDDKSLYPLFGRTITSERGYAAAYILLLRQKLRQVRYLAVVHVDDEYGNAFAAGLRWAAETFNVLKDMQIQTIAVPARQVSEEVWHRAVRVLRETRYQYIAACVYDEQINSLLLQAYAQGIAGTGKHTWFLPLGTFLIANAVVPRNSPLARAYQGTMAVDIRFLVSTDDESIEPSARQFIRAIGPIRDSDVDMDYVRSKLPNQGAPFVDNPMFLKQAPFVNNAYDATVALGLAACRALKKQKQQQINQEGTSSLRLDGQGHFDAFLQTHFDGTTGRVVFDNVTGTRDASSVVLALTNFVANPNLSNESHVFFESIDAGTFRNGQWNLSRPLIFNDGTSNIPSDVPTQTVDRNYLTGGLRAGGLVMFGLIMLQAVGFGAWTYWNRHARVVRHSQPIFLHLLCVGAALMGAAIIPAGIDKGVCRTMDGCHAACVAFPWLLSVGFTVLFSALFTKTHRLNRIIKASESFRRMVLTPLDVAKPMFALLGANLLVLSLWTGLDPLRYETKVVSRDEIFFQPTETYGMCTSQNAVPYGATLGLINLGALGFAVFEAARSKGFATENNESEYIFKAMMGILLACFVGIPVIVIARELPQAYIYVFTAMIFLTSSLVLLLIFVPKIVAMNEKPKGMFGWQSTQFISTTSLQAPPRTTQQQPAGGGGGGQSPGPPANFGIRVSVHPKKAAEDMEIFNKLLQEEVETLENEKDALTDYIKRLKQKYSIPDDDDELENGNVLVQDDEENGSQNGSLTEPTVPDNQRVAVGSTPPRRSPSRSPRRSPGRLTRRSVAGSLPGSPVRSAAAAAAHGRARSELIKSFRQMYPISESSSGGRSQSIAALSSNDVEPTSRPASLQEDRVSSVVSMPDSSDLEDPWDD